MGRKILFIVLMFVSASSFGQEKKVFHVDEANVYFKETEVAAKKSENLWGKNIYGPIMLINPETREIYANNKDSLGELRRDGRIYTGVFSKNENIANTSIRWNGTEWATVMLPLPENKYDRIGLLIHERFHAMQPELGFILRGDGNNVHLDSKDGRIYLRLELGALKKAVSASTASQINDHVTNAFIFRKYRQSLFPGSDIQENKLELNEGLAEYTGEASCGRPEKLKAEHFVRNIDASMLNPTFIRSFAYQTIPVYGYLLDKKQQGWNRKTDNNTNLTDFFITAFKIKLPENLKDAVSQLAGSYNGEEITNEETIREENRKKLVVEYKSRFIEQPHFEIKFEKMNISFDPRNIMPLENRGTVYPNITVMDQWGILSVTDGALLSPDWRKITVTNPTDMNGNKLSGKGWTLELNKGYSVVITDGNFGLKKD
ncbi:hypothetical protein [Dysgonomonas reticulitermitis]